MDSLWESFLDYFRDFFIDGIVSNMAYTFGSVNREVAEIATEVGQSPSDFMPNVFSLVRSLSENVIMPIAGIVLTFIACYELIQLIISHNNLANFETWIFFKWIFKTFIAVELITHTFDITMAIFDVAQHVVQQSGSIITSSTEVTLSDFGRFIQTLETKEIGELATIYMQSSVVQLLMNILSVLIYVIVNGRMLQIYLMVSMAPIPFATFGNREQSLMGQNYVKSLFALGFQGFLIMLCVGIYAVLVQQVTFTEDIIGSLWTVVGFTVLLGYTLFKTDDISKQILGAH